MRLPEVRVRLEQIAPDGVLHWRLEGSLPDTVYPPATRHGEAGVYTASERIREAILGSGAPPGAVWRPGAARHGEPGAAAWVDHVEEAYTPEGRVPQALYRHLREFGWPALEAIPAGTRNFGDVEVFVPDIAVGDPVAIVSPTAIQYLGAIEALEPELVTEHATRSAFDAGSALCRLEDGVRAPEAGTESEHHQPGGHRRVEAALDGVYTESRLGPFRYTLRIAFSFLPEPERRAWMEFLKETNVPPSLLVVRTDLSIVEGVVERAESQLPGGSLRAEFRARPVLDPSIFAAVET